MKQFLYLDSDIVMSIIAQAEKGYVIQTSEEKGDITDKSIEKAATLSGMVKGGGSFWKFLQAEADISGDGDLKKVNGLHSSTKYISEKILHDAAFDLAYSYIQPHLISFGDQEYDYEGNYLEIHRLFDFVDMEYLENLFAKDGIIDYLKKEEAIKIENEFEEKKKDYNRSQLRQVSANIKKELNKAVKLSNKQYDDIGAIIKMIRGLIPYNQMLVSGDGYLIPLEDKYFRVDPSSLGFKYGGEINCVGMVTKIIGEDCNTNDDWNIFATLQYTVNEALRGFLPTKQSNLCVLHPIAVYYGE